MNRVIKKRIFPLALAAIVGALLLLMLLTQGQRFDATAAGEPYSVSLNSPVTFPVDI